LEIIIYNKKDNKNNIIGGGKSERHKAQGIRYKAKGIRYKAKGNKQKAKKRR